MTWTVLAVGGAILLYALQALYSSGQPLLAAMLLGVGVLGLWTYSFGRSQACLLYTSPSPRDRG